MLCKYVIGDSRTLHKCELLKVVVDMCARLLHLYEELPSFPELFSPLDSNLKELVPVLVLIQMVIIMLVSVNVVNLVSVKC